MSKPEKIFDGLLVLQYRKGDKKALSLLVKRWHPRLCKQAYWYTKDTDRAKDIAQDSWSVILRTLHTLKDVNSFGSWALTIVNRKALDWIRTSKRADIKLHQYYEDSNKKNDTIKAYRSVNTDSTAVAAHYTEAIMNAIKDLPANQELIIRMFYVEEYSIHEISTILKISSGTVKSRLFYAREKLKLILKNIKNEK